MPTLTRGSRYIVSRKMGGGCAVCLSCLLLGWGCWWWEGVGNPDSDIVPPRRGAREKEIWTGKRGKHVGATRELSWSSFLPSRLDDVGTRGQEGYLQNGDSDPHDKKSKRSLPFTACVVRILTALRTACRSQSRPGQGVTRRPKASAGRAGHRSHPASRSPQPQCCGCPG